MATTTIYPLCGAMPVPVAIFQLGIATVGQGTYILSPASSAINAYSLYSVTHADGDNISFPFYASRGTYTFYCAYRKLSNCGIVRLYVDDVSIGTVDLYNGTTVDVNLASITSVAIGHSGAHTLKILTDGKNASSSGYYIVLNEVSFVRTS